MDLLPSWLFWCALLVAGCICLCALVPDDDDTIRKGTTLTTKAGRKVVVNANVPRDVLERMTKGL